MRFISIFACFVLIHAPALAAEEVCTKAFLGINRRVAPHFVVEPNGSLHMDFHDPTQPGLRLLNAIPRLLHRVLGIHEMSQAYKRLATDSRDVDVFTKMVDAFEMKVEYDPSSLDRIPASGSLLVTMNHTLFGLDGAAMASALSKKRPDVKVVLTDAFENIPELQGNGIFVSSKGDRKGLRKNLAALKQMQKWLKDGHVLVIFPAGQPSKFQVPGIKTPLDAPWNRSIAKMVEDTGAATLPVFVHGGASQSYLNLNKFNQGLGSMFLLKEIARLKGSTAKFEIGSPISAEDLLQAGAGAESKDSRRQAIVDYLRAETYRLGGIVEPPTP